MTSRRIFCEYNIHGYRQLLILDVALEQYVFLDKAAIELNSADLYTRRDLCV